jgi:hypothetical protein
VAWAVDPCTIPNFTVSANPGINAPVAIVVDDFNKDGRPDIAAASSNSAGPIAILLGNGSGGFSAAPNITAVRSPTSIASGDLNGDGNPDLVVGNGTNVEGELAIFLGNGAGGFGPRIQKFIALGLQNRISGVAIADFNGDGNRDIAASSSTFSNISILTGNGSGNVTFLRSVSSGGFAPSFLMARDVNGDTKSDLLVTNPGSGNNNIAIELGDGAGNFAAPVIFLSGSNPGSFDLADVDGDSKLDLAVTLGGTVTILRGDGAGNFGNATSFSLNGTSGASPKAADFNADGKLDLALASPAGYLMIATGDGSGGFQVVANFVGALSNFQFGLNALAIADFDGDARPDAAVGSQSPAKVTVFLNGCGSAVPNQIQLSATGLFLSEFDGSVAPSIVRSGDITGSATVDYATADNTAIAGQDYTAISGTLNFGPGESSKALPISIINDNIDEPNETFSLTLTNALGTVLVDPKTTIVTIFDDDPAPAASITDTTVFENNSGQSNAVFTVSLSNPSSSSVTINYSTADGLATAGADYQTTSGTLTFSAGEVTRTINVPVFGDVLAELNETFVVNLSGPVNATLADAQGVGTILDDDSSCPAPSFGAGIDFAVNNNPFDLAAADLNGDGNKDLAVANRGSNNVSILLGNGAASFSAPTTVSVGFGPSQIAAADFNGDGKVDLVTVNTGGSPGIPSVSVLLGNGSGGFAVTTSQAVPSPMGLAVADFNADGKPDLALLQTGSKVSLLFGNGTGGFGAPTDYSLPGTSPIFISVGDFNGDSKSDLVVANLNSNNVSVLLNNGSGVLGAAITSPAGANPQTVAARDLNGDGKADLVVANSFAATSILIGDGAGAFSLLSTMNFGARPFGVTLADLNADGKLDIAIADIATGSPLPEVGGVWVLFGNGDGAFSAPVKYSVGNNPGRVVAADFNGDSKLDLAAVVTGSTKVSLLLNTCSAATVSLSAATYSVGEGGGRVNVTVNRGGDTSAPATVDYATSDKSGSTSCNVSTGNASARCDYTNTLGTLRFAANEASKVILIPIIDDSYNEGPGEEFTITLSNATGAIIGPTSTATITITDNDSSTGPNPIDQATFFVRQHYLDFLNREPDQSGWDFWTNQITVCGADVQCTEVRRIDVSASFFLSIEFQQTGYLVEKMYKAAYGPATGNSTFNGAHTLPVPIVRLSEFLAGTQRIGQGVIVLQPGWEQLLESNKHAYATEFVQTSRFTTAFPTTMTPADFVDRLNQNAGNVLSASERSTAIDLFGSASNTANTAARAQALRQVSEDQDLTNAEFNRAFVLMQYFGYLRRNPNDAPESGLDYTGYDFWLTKLNQFNGNYIQAEMVKAFLSSIEYRQRFAP